MKAVGQIFQGTAYLEQGKFSQRIAERNALMTERDGSVQEGEARDASRKGVGAQLVAQGGSGFEMGTGTALDALLESQTNGIMDALTIRRAAASKAASTRFGGTLQKMEADGRAMGEFFGAASTVVDHFFPGAGGG